jgi:transposase
MVLIDWPIPNIFPFTHSSHVAILTDNNRWNIRIWAHYDMVSQQTAFRPKLAPDLNP